MTANQERVKSAWTMLDLDTLKPGDRIYRWHDAGGAGMEVSPYTVVRVNRLTITVTEGAGCDYSPNGRGYMPRQDVVGIADWEDEEEKARAIEEFYKYYKGPRFTTS